MRRGTDRPGHLPRGLSSGLAETAREPLILLTAERHPQDRLRIDLRFVNLSGEVLDCVASGADDFASADETLPVTDNGRLHVRVEPMGSVLIDTFHEALDCDLALTVGLTVSSRGLGTREFSISVSAPEFENAVLLWDADLHPEVRRRAPSMT